VQILNPLRINDWEIKSCLEVVIFIQIAVIGFTVLGILGFNVPVVRPITGFVYLTFIPGILLLRILRIHKLSAAETLLYSVGLSIALLMLTGLLMNFILPLIGVSEPISLVPLVAVFGAEVAVLSWASYKRDRSFSDCGHIDTRSLVSSPVLFLSLIPFLPNFGVLDAHFKLFECTGALSPPVQRDRNRKAAKKSQDSGLKLDRASATY